jgi:hypothetical protein
MKIKVAYGDFGGGVCAPGANVQTTSSITKVIYAITNRCRVHGVFFFNIESIEAKINLTDIASGDHAAGIAAPVVYSTIVPRDQSFSKTITLYDGEVVDWTMTFALDLYDSPTGIYDTFPKPGFLFENGVCVCNRTSFSAANSDIHYIIFYSE